MPRGRHRHSPPLHRMLPPSAIAGVSLVCALGPWVFTQPMVLRVLAAAAAVTAIVGAVVMRHWDTQAGKRVADLTRARASDEWRFEERVAELESDLEESRELRMKLEQRLRAKRAELTGLRNEHAALLRRYAAAEADRASVLEERRMLEIEAAVPARALPAGPSSPAGSATPATPAPAVRETGTAGAAGSERTAEAERTAPAVFSPQGRDLFRHADAALARLAGVTGRAASARTEDTAAGGVGTAAGTPQATADAEAKPADADSGTVPADQDAAAPAGRTDADEAPHTDETARTDSADETAPADAAAATVPAPAPAPEADAAPRTNAAPASGRSPEDDGPEPTRKAVPAQEDGSEGRSAAGDHEGTAAAAPAAPAEPVHRTTGHFTVPTAVAVVPPTAPARRPVSGGDGFDFFGTKKDTGRSGADTVQNEDLADVVGQEALALHKAEAEAGFKPADEDARGIGQVIDLTAHDETEHIDVQGLRSAVS
ncbi:MULTISPECIES: hypothetical protein [Streptomyces]|nr:hypothetical protein [Streptomyces calvus]MBA8976932.1 hypothetical protein [Streptomyces calvus]